MTRLSDEELARLRAFAIDEMRAINPSPMYERGRALRALLDEITRLRESERTAWRRGQEEMRERVIDFFDRDKVYSGLEVRELVRGYLFDTSKGGE